MKGTPSPAWLALFEAARRVCEERTLMHWPKEIPALDVPGAAFGYAPDCPACALRAAFEGVGGTLREGVSS